LLLERILKGEDDFNKSGPNNQLARITDLVSSDYCENCHEKGHKTWACSL